MSYRFIRLNGDFIAEPVETLDGDAIHGWYAIGTRVLFPKYTNEEGVINVALV